MNSRKIAIGTSVALIAGIASGWPDRAYAQESNPPAADAPTSSNVSYDQDVEDSEIEAVEEYVLAPAASPDVTNEERPKPFIINARAEYQFDTGIDNAGDFNVARVVGGGGMKFPLGERLGGAIGGSYSYAGYDFDDDALFGGSEPWGDVQTAQFLAVLRYTVNDQWSILGGGTGAFSGESGADAASSFTGGGFLAGGYRASEHFYIQLGASVVSQLDDDPLVTPLVIVNWAIDDRWQLRAGVLETGATDAVGAGVSYRMNEQWSVGARVGYVIRRFRLDDSGFAPDGVGQDEQFRAALSLTWKPIPEMQVSLLGGAAFGGELRVEDDNGDRLVNEDYDPTPFVGAGMTWRF